MAEVLSDPALHAFMGGAPDIPQALRSRYQRLTAGSADPAVSWLNWVIRRRDGEIRWRRSLDRSPQGTADDA